MSRLDILKSLRHVTFSAYYYRLSKTIMYRDASSYLPRVTAFGRWYTSLKISIPHPPANLSALCCLMLLACFSLLLLASPSGVSRRVVHDDFFLRSTNPTIASKSKPYSYHQSGDFRLLVWAPVCMYCDVSRWWHDQYTECFRQHLIFFDSIFCLAR